MNLDIQEVGWEVHDLDCTVLVQDRNRRRVMVSGARNLRLP